MGKVIFPSGKNVKIMQDIPLLEKQYAWLNVHFPAKEHASQTFLRRPKKFLQNVWLSGCIMHSDNGAHSAASAFRTETDVDVPYGF